MNKLTHIEKCAKEIEKQDKQMRDQAFTLIIKEANSIASIMSSNFTFIFYPFPTSLFPLSIILEVGLKSASENSGSLL